MALTTTTTTKRNFNAIKITEELISLLLISFFKESIIALKYYH